jgi:hypothetical protein
MLEQAVACNNGRLLIAAQLQPTHQPAGALPGLQGGRDTQHMHSTAQHSTAQHSTAQHCTTNMAQIQSITKLNIECAWHKSLHTN